jgi:predicted O-linked N-acetylglucosamine transferase (SPINDLY family)
MISYRTDLAAAHLKARRPAEALPQLLFALSRGAASPELHNNLGAALRDLGRFKEAASAFRNAVTMRPGYLQAQQNLAEALRLSGDLEGAIAALRSLAARAPQSVAVHQELNDIGDESGDLELKLWSLRRLLELQPHAANVHSALLYNLHYDPLMTPAALFEEHLKWHRAFGEVTSYTQLRHNFSNGRRIRVGYVSPDFRHHTVPRFIGAALKHHDRGRFEVFCYSDVAKDDGMTELLRSYVEHWRDVVGLPNDRAEQIIREDGIDILVDLRGHAAGNRLRLFARKPAPIQINMVGYFDTTGLSAIDYRLTDVNQDPVGVSEKYHCEQLIRMPGTCWCYTADEDAPDIAPPPCERKGFIMLGSLNKLIKISEPCAKLWLRTLDAIPHSRLLLHVPSDRSANAIRQRLEKFGLPAARLELTAKAASRRAYLERFNEIDIALDTFPFNGITTTCDALYMAVPVVSLSGGTTVSRAGASILHGVGLPYLATATEQEFIDTAVSIAGDRIALVELRRGLRDRMRNSPLMNHIGFTRSLETQYERMCRQLQEEA